MSGARQAAAAALLGLALVASTARAQLPGQGGVGGFGGVGGIGSLIPNINTGQTAPGLGQLGAGQPLDSATARMLGLPTAPTRKLPEPDSVMAALLQRPGYKVTRFIADSARLFPEDRRLRLEGNALAQQQSATLEADTIAYQQANCVLDASGTPRLFDKAQVLVGKRIAYNTCTRRGIVKGALTSVAAGQTSWFVRGNVSADSSATRIYAGSSDITSCDLPTPHYHFAARQVKWVSKHVMVARPIVLYVRDVPILWLPFIFQDLRPGRRSGILIPQLGISDIIRPSRSYQRQISNIGYYWATNDYMDLTGRIDWFANRYVQFGVSGQYNIL
ncbi:MAG TPA: putative LPS assembly protein LptD, partial [Gemmatimonadales bacterium]|nr:putative LPS assembly protein LptD [Gemmatimonadales bacterium]